LNCTQHSLQLKKSLPVKAALRPRYRQKCPATNEIHITGDVKVQGNVIIDNKKKIKILDSTFKKLLDKMKLPAASCGVSRRNCAVALTRLRSIELRRGSPCLSILLQAAWYSGEGE